MGCKQMRGLPIKQRSLYIFIFGLELLVSRLMARVININALTSITIRCIDIAAIWTLIRPAVAPLQATRFLRVSICRFREHPWKAASPPKARAEGWEEVALIEERWEGQFSSRSKYCKAFRCRIPKGKWYLPGCSLASWNHLIFHIFEDASGGMPGPLQCRLFCTTLVGC